MYLTLKHLHITLAVITAGGFMLRTWWSVSGAPLHEHRLVRVLPHFIDTLLLCSGIGMLVLASMSLTQHTWLLWKLVGLLVYIVAGSVAIRYGRTPRIRLIAAIIAVTVFVYIVGVALNKTGLSWLAGGL
ncbi:MAG: SirB2 family protein [Pseudomonadota bacterium]